MNLNNISSQCIQNRITLLHNQHKCINDLFYILFLFFVLSPRNPMSAFAHLHLKWPQPLVVRPSRTSNPYRRDLFNTV